MNIQDKTDTELVILLTQGEETAFTELYVRYKDKLYYFCVQLLKSDADANDIIQEIFIRVWESRLFINPDLSFSAFLYTMTRNRIFNHFRDMDIKEKVKEMLAIQEVEEEVSIDSDIIYTEYKQILQKAIEQLPPQRQKIFNMSRLQNMSHKEIAAELGISVNTVQEHISQALRFIKLYFNKHADVPLGLLLWMVI